MAALFARGISTADEVTEYSGRGIGLIAVPAACAERGGRIDVEREPGRGVFKFPSASMAPAPEALLQTSSVPRALVA